MIAVLVEKDGVVVIVVVDGVRKYCRQETVVVPRVSAGAGGNYYNNSLKALARMNKMMTKLALSRPKREAK